MFTILLDRLDEEEEEEEEEEEDEEISCLDSILLLCNQNHFTFK